MPNRLANETSPYLLQHANNPVDWYAWGPEALARAKSENKPILLSIGYAACHWCHVMEHESFEDAETAAIMNEHYVCIKVDREERPDLDGIYMQAVQAMTGHGGWPMTMFLTPDGVPFYGGTYFPKEERHGLPSFSRILLAISNTYNSKPDDIDRSAAQVREMYAASTEATRSGGPLAPALLEHAYRTITVQYDAGHGGFGGAPKFPQTMALDFVLRHSARRGVEQGRQIVVDSFRHMARGGIYDQVGGGFARYAVDAIWLVPHFEKMLYDNALLARLGLHLWQATGDEEIRRVTEETLDWVMREMTSPEGGFYSSYDADSEGHEGKFYVWTASEIDAVLGNDAAVARAYWGVTPDGNFEGKTILSVPEDPSLVARRLGVSQAELSAAIARAKVALYDARAKRVWPGLDDKILTSWNALMLRALADAARAFASAEYRAMAVRNATFLFDALVRDGRVLRTYKNGAARLSGYLEDHAALALAALSVYELTFDRVWLERARQLSRTMIEAFWDDATGAFYDTARDHEALITRPREPTDNAIPAGTSLAVELLVRTAELFHDVDDRRRATYVVETLAPMIARYPMAFGHLLGAADMLINGAVELALVGDPASTDFGELAKVAASVYAPWMVLAGGLDTDGIALLQDRTMRDGKATAYLCRNYSCDEPATSASQLSRQLDS